MNPTGLATQRDYLCAISSVTASRGVFGHFVFCAKPPAPEEANILVRAYERTSQLLLVTVAGHRRVTSVPWNERRLWALTSRCSNQTEDACRRTAAPVNE